MADIDKSLSELGTSVKIEGPDQQVELEKQEEALKEPVQVTPTEDGGVELDFDPSKVNIEGQPNHFDNLAELLPDDILDPIGSELFQNYMDYKASRKDWEKGYTEGLDLLGFKYENQNRAFPRCFRCHAPCASRSCNTIPSRSLQRIITIRRTNQNTDCW